MSRALRRAALFCAAALPLSSAVVATAPQPATAASFVMRSVAGFSPVTDAYGQVWQARTGFIGGSRLDNNLNGVDVAGTTSDNLYRLGGLDLTGFSTAVPAAGTYQVRVLMAEGYWSSAGKRVFDVTAEGSTKLSAVDIYGAVGSRRAYDRTFTVTVNDGRLDLGFVRRVDLPRISAIEVTQVPTPSLAPAPAPTPAGPAPLSTGDVPFSPTSFWSADISKAPLTSNSWSMANNLNQQVVTRYGGIAGFNAYDYSVPLVRVPAGTPKVNVAFYDCQGQPSNANYLTQSGGPFIGVPVPSNLVVSGGHDKAVSIYDRSTDQLWEFWKFSKNSSGKWQACWGGRIDHVSSSPGHFSGTYGAAATGLAFAGGIVTLDDVRRGYIDHAIFLSVVTPRHWSVKSWPAQRSDGLSWDGNTLIEGQRLRLDPSVDVSTLGMGRVGAMVARAAQKYGFVVGDKGGAVAIGVESGAMEQAVTGKNPWDTLLGGPTYTVMKGFPWQRVQVLPQDYGRP